MTKHALALLLLTLTANFVVQFPARVLAEPADDVRTAMQLLKSKAAKLGAPNVKGEETVAGKKRSRLVLWRDEDEQQFCPG